MTPQLLIVKIQAALAGRSEESQMQRRALAMEYCRQCSEAELRIEHCIALLKAGREYPALQVAESSDLLDTVNSLVFAELGQWRDFCAADGLPVPVPFDEKQIEMISSLYSKGITQAHPLYRDYRRAMRLREYDKALSIIRTISKINSYDAEARREYDRLRKRVSDAKLSELSAALHSVDEAAVLDICAALEPEAELIADSAVWKKALEIRKSSEARVALKRISEIVANLHTLNIDEDWSKAVAMISELNMLSSVAKLSEADAAFIEDISAASAQRQRAAIEQEKASRARNLLVSALEQPDGRSLSAQLSLLLKLKAEAAVVLGDELSKKTAAKISFLRFKKRVRLALVSVGAVAGALALAALVFTSYSRIAQGKKIFSAETELAAIEQSQDYKSVEGLIADFKKKYPDIAARPETASRIFQASEGAKAALGTAGRVESAIARLENFDFSSAASSDCDLAYADIEKLQAEILNLSAYAQVAARSRLDAVGKRAAKEIDARRLKLNSELRTGLDKYEGLLSEYETFSRDKLALDADVNKLLRQLRPMIEDVSRLFRPHQIDVDRFNDISVRITDARSKYGSFDSLRSALMTSRSKAEYLAAVDMLAASPYVPAAFSKKLSKITAQKEAIELGQLLEFSDAQAVLHAGDVRGFSRGTFGDDSRMLDDVYVYVLPRGAKVYSLGEMKERTQKWTGGSETLQEVNEISAGGSVNRNIYRLHSVDGKPPLGELLSGGALTPESDLGKRAANAAAQNSMLSALTLVANAKVDPVYKARLESLIYRELDKNPIASGLAFSPSALVHRVDVMRCAAGYLDYSWIFESDSRRKFVEAELYKNPYPDFEAEAKLYIDAIKTARKTPLVMVGIVGEGGKVEIFKEYDTAPWSVEDASGKFRRFDKGSDPSSSGFAPLGPIFAEVLTKGQILEKASGADKK